MNWYEELRLSRHPIDEIGVAFYVRLMMRNRLQARQEDLREVFGQDWRRMVSGLQRSGAMDVERAGGSYVLKVVAPGDDRRAAIRKAAREIRKRLKQEGTST